MTLLPNKLLAKSTILGFATAVLMSAAASAQNKDQEIGALATTQKADLATIACWDVVTLAEDDRASALVLIYGYLVGEKGNSIISPQDIQVAIVTTMTKCVDEPDSKVMDLMKEQMSRLSE
jgi:hypothetical protein